MLSRSTSQTEDLARKCLPGEQEIMSSSPVLPHTQKNQLPYTMQA